MNKISNDERIISDYFNKIIKKYKVGPKAVGYGSRNSQIVRFEALSQIGNLNGKSILDVGCGFGDFYGFLINNKKLKLKKYLGIDTNPNMILAAKKKYPKAEFIVGDLMEKLPKESFDYVLESGIFNIEIPNWKKFTYKVLVRMYGMSRIGMGINFLSSLSPFKKEKNSHYVNPCEMLEFIFTKFTSKVVFRHDYKLNDFTIFAYKDSLKK